MLRNYLLVSIRNLKRHFTYSFVNIFGLTIGLASTMIIGSWVQQEYSYEKHFDQSEEIFRVGVNFFNIGNLSIGPEALKTTLTNYPSVESTTGLASIGTVVLQVNNKEINQPNVYKSDADFFKIFSYEFISGNRSTALSEPNGMVISEEVAQKLFGTTDVIDQVIKLKDDPASYYIRGVVSTKRKTHIATEVWISSAGKTTDQNWLSAGGWIYVLMKRSGDPGKDLNSALDNIIETEIHPMIAANDPLDQFIESGIYQFLPIAISDIHLRSELKFEPSPGGNELTTQVFAGVALLILLLACINFVNISTARASVRAKEVGIRKSLGTKRYQLIYQFIIESVLICLLAVTIGFIIGEFFLDGFEEITNIELLPTLFTDPARVLTIILLAILVGIVTGLYPAFYITSFQTVKVLKGEMAVDEKGFVRSGLVLFQFVISISLIIVSMFIFNQLRFMQNRDMGFETENVLVIRNLDQIQGNGQLLKQQILNLPQAINASLAQRVPASSTSSVESIFKEDQEEEIWAQRFTGDEDMIDCLGYRLLSGRNFSSEMATDTSALILNEAAALMFGWVDPIGKTLNDGSLRIIGVVDNFNFESLKNKIGPVILRYNPESENLLTIKTTGSNTASLLDQIRTIWSVLGAVEGMDYYFLEDSFQKLVEKERVLSRAILIFTFLAILISCLGLYGLAAFIADRKTKEIGIRRVMGASINDVNGMLSRKFIKPILIAFLISVPISYLLVDQWLSNYAYHISIRPIIFLLGGFIAFFIGLATVFWQSFKVAHRNPILSLRNE